MQIIQKIRDKGAVIGFITIGLSLIAFILMEAKQGNSRSASSSSTSLGKVNGEDIDHEKFDQTVKDQQARYGPEGNAQLNYIRQRTWDQMVGEVILNDEFTKLGLTFAPKEMTSIMFSDNAPQTLKELFTDKNTGQYDIEKAMEWWPTVKKLKDDQQKAVEDQIIEPMKVDAMYRKYTCMIAASVYTPTWLQQKQLADSKKFATISYVSVPYASINDNPTVSDDEITDYVKNHAAAYQQEEGRYISYVSFNASPSASDTADVIKSLHDQRADFEADTSAKSFLALNSSAIDFNDDYILKSKLTGPQKDSIASLPKGKVFGPYLDGKNIVLAKKIDEKEIPDSAKCRHILISVNDPSEDSAAKVLIDSIAAAIKGGADFNSMVLKYSGDSGSVHKGGEYTFAYTDFETKKIVPEFGETIFYGKTGDKKVVHTKYGWHYIEVLEQKNIQPAYQVAYFAKQVLPGDETIGAASSAAAKLPVEAQDAKSFDAYVAKNGLTKITVPTMLKESDYQVGNLVDARQLVKWAFTAKEGDVSPALPIGDNYIVAVLNKVQEKGLPDAATARPLVERLVINQKKADKITSDLGANPTLESAAKTYKTQILTAGNDSTLTFSNPIINGLGEEPKLIGAAFNKDMSGGKESEPIAGTNGVYLIKVNSIAEKPADSPDVIAQKNMQETREQQQALMVGWFESLKKLADIKDDRSKYL